MTVGGKVENVPDVGVDESVQPLERSSLFRKPDGSRRRTGHHEIEGTVVVEIGEKYPRRARGPSRLQFRPRGPRFLVPPLGDERGASNRPEGFERYEIEHAVGVDISDCESQIALLTARGPCEPLELSSLEVGEHLKRAALVDRRRIGIAVAVNVAPHEGPNADRVGKRLERPPRPIAVVPEHERRRRANTNDNVQVTVHLDVGGPDSCRIHRGWPVRPRGARSLVGERAVGGLDEQAHARGTRGDEVHLEIVIPVECEQARDARRDSRKRRRCRRWLQPMHLLRIGGEQDRTLLIVERKSRHRTE